MDAPEAAEIDRLIADFAELIRASPHNLLSARGLEELEVRHLPEALAFARTLPTGRRLLDVGSGGGLPGMVIAIARPELEVHLLEATGKKAEFLATSGAALGVTVTVHHGRAEQLSAGPLKGSFYLVTARAVAPLERLIPLVAPYLGPRGQLHAIKGERWAEELEAAAGQLGQHGLSVISTPRPDQGPAAGPRVIVVERSSKGVGRKTK